MSRDCINRQDAINVAIQAADDWDGGYNPERAEMIERGLKMLPALQAESCEDCISRESIKQKLQKQHDFFVNVYGGYSNLPQSDKSRVDEISNCIAMVVNELPATPQPKAEPRWIPVSERLPEEYLCNDGYIEPSDYVLVWGDHGNYGVSRYWGNRRSKSESSNTYKDWVDLDWVVQKPVAWMPLPEPYKAESEE